MILLNEMSLCDLHNIIDILILKMSQCPGEGSPQITRGVAMDVHKGIMKIGRYVNPCLQHGSYIFKTDDDVNFTIQKLMYLQMVLYRFVDANIPDIPSLRAHAEILKEHLQYSIRFLEKKM